jgi:hypothetical protein
MLIRLIAFFLLTCAATQSYTQNFCGHIKYRYTYRNTKTGKNVTKKTNDIKTEDFYICGNKFKIYFDGGLQNIYIGDTVTYFQASSEKKLGYIRADSAYGQEAPVYTRRVDPAMYNGKAYHAIETGEEGDKIAYYYNESIRIDPALFKDFMLYHWNEFFNATNGGIRLVSVYVETNLTTISEAIQIEEQPLTDRDFTIPEGYTAEPYASMNVEN